MLLPLYSGRKVTKMKPQNRNVTLRALCVAFLAVLVTQPACNPFCGSPYPDVCTPRSDQDILASMAIRRAVITPGDVPDGRCLSRNPAIVLSAATSYITIQGDTVYNLLTVCSLPHKRSVRFSLLTREQIQARADDHGDFLYLSIGEIKETPDGALVTIETKWALAKDSHVGILSGGGYILLFRKDGSKWSFDKVVLTWIS